MEFLGWLIPTVVFAVLLLVTVVIFIVRCMKIRKTEIPIGNCSGKTSEEFTSQGTSVPPP